ncbi:MAG: DNA polymerase III subunit delta [Prevotella sp.]|nr:DNA polymerase III subunit delta [Prevotella sp.]
MQFSKVIGQKEAQQRLKQLVDEQRIPHAMLITGPEGCGKMAMALAFASFLLGERWDGRSQLGSEAEIANAEAMLRKWAHPDLHFSFPIIKPKNAGSDRKVACDEYIKEWGQLLDGGPYFTLEQWMKLMNAENQQAQIFEAESDALAHKLYIKSTMGGYKVSLIWLPERMNATCANKLLKLLEEPPMKTVFLLVSEHPELLIDTIRSRVQRFDMRRIDDADIEQALIEKRSIVPADAHRIARIAAGNWLKALETLSADNENRQFFDLFVLLMRKAFTRDVKELKHWSETVAAFGREKQRRFITYMLRMVRENFMYNFRQPDLCYMTQQEEAFATKFARFINERNVLIIQQQLQDAMRDIGQNANGKIQFFDFALEMVINLRR